METINIYNDSRTRKLVKLATIRQSAITVGELPLSDVKAIADGYPFANVRPEILIYSGSKTVDGSTVVFWDSVRINGKPQIWKTRPNDCRLPVKWGFRDAFSINWRNGVPDRKIAQRTY